MQRQHLRPGGRLVFLTNSVLVTLCVPQDEGYATDRLMRGQRDARRVHWPGGGVEFHPGHGDWIRILHANGFTDTDGLLAVDTVNRTFAFRAPAVLTHSTDGTRVNTELIRKDRIAPAVRLHEWARAAVGAANGLEASG